MSRSRLDEIVEEELGEKYGPQITFDAICKRIAERAFLHGVEQSVEATKVLQGHRFDLNGLGLAQILALGAEAAQKQIRDVQPAPAGESKRLVYRTCSVNGNVYAAEESRKGERRSLLNPTSYVALPPGGLTRVYKWRENVEPWLPDRRSGHDRRSSPSTDKDRRK